MNHRLQFSRGLLAASLVVALAGSAAAQGRIGGTVRNENDQPIRGATVTARNPDAQPDLFTTTTDDRGRFAMIGLPRGTWEFSVTAPGYIPDGGTVNIRAINANPPFAFKLRKPAAGPSALGSVDARDLQAQLTAADALYNTQRWDEAIAAYKAILVKAPALSSISLQIAAAYRNKKEFDSAIGVYSELLKTNPANDRARVGMALTNVEKGDLDAAERTLEVAAQSAGATREVFQSLGDVKQAKSKVDEALRAYERASQADPTWGKPVYALGRLAMSRGDTASALTYFEKVVLVDPMSPEAAQARAAVDQLKR